jgi:hypothetical protein
MAVFADTGYEPVRVYQHLSWCKKEAKKYNIPIHVVKGGINGLKQDVLDNIPNEHGGRVATLPYFTATIEGKNEGIALRQCTQEFKIAPIEKFLRTNIGLKPRQHAPKEPVIQQWIGISHDESPRAKPSRTKWIEHVFPFLNWGIDSPDGKVWRRYQIINWLEQNYPDIEVPRSACICCPFHSNKEWRKIKENPEEWKDACDFDDSIRIDKRGKMKSRQYLHRSCKPLRDVDIRSDEEKGQGNLWDNECEGMCGM